MFGFRTIDDCNAIVRKAKQSKRAAVIGGGLLGLEAARGLLNHGCEVHVVHLAGHLMEMQLDTTGGAILQIEHGRDGRQRPSQEARPAKCSARTRVTGLGFKDGTTLDCDMVVVAAGIRPNAEIGLRCGLTVERAIVVDNHMRSVDDFDIYVVGECAQHRGHVYGLVAPLWEQAKVFADHITGTASNAAYHGSKLATKLKVMGVELASMGITEPAEDRDEVIQFTEPKKGTYKKLIVRDGRLVGGILMGDISKAAYLMQALRPRHAAARRAAVAAVRSRRAQPRRSRIDEMPADDAGLQLQRRHQGAPSAPAWRPATAAPKAVMDATRAGMGCGSCKGLVGEIVDWFCGGEVEEDPSVHYYVPCIPLTQARTRQGDPRAGAANRSRRSSTRWPAGSRTPPASRRWPRCSSRSGPANTRTSATRASSTTACTATSRRTAPSRSFPKCPAASARRPS